MKAAVHLHELAQTSSQRPGLIDASLTVSAGVQVPSATTHLRTVERHRYAVYLNELSWAKVGTKSAHWPRTSLSELAQLWWHPTIAREAALARD